MYQPTDDGIAQKRYSVDMHYKLEERWRRHKRKDSFCFGYSLQAKLLPVVSWRTAYEWVSGRVFGMNC